MRLSPHPVFHRLCYQAFNQSSIESCSDCRQFCGSAQAVDFGLLFSCYSQLLADALENGGVPVGQHGQVPPVEQHQIAVSLLAALLLWNLHMLNSIKYGPLSSQNYYRIVKDKSRTYYEVYSLPRAETPPEGCTQISFVCLRPDGAYKAPATISSVCRYSRKKIGDMDDLHFHLLRHTYTTNLLSHRAAPKDVQELLGHSDVSSTMNIFAHAAGEAKRTSAKAAG